MNICGPGELSVVAIGDGKTSDREGLMATKLCPVCVKKNKVGFMVQSE